MSLGELLLTLLVALIAFGPKQLPLLAKHLSQGMRLLQQIQSHVSLFWQEQINAQQLQENTEKALKADETYQ